MCLWCYSEDLLLKIVCSANIVNLDESFFKAVLGMFFFKPCFVLSLHGKLCFDVHQFIYIPRWISEDHTFTQTLLHFSFIAYNPSSHQCTERRQALSAELENLLEYQDDSNAYVKQSLLMDMLDLTDDNKSILTRTVKSAFPNSVKKTIMIDRQLMYPLKHLYR